jgi:hypothetical protein
MHRAVARGKRRLKITTRSCEEPQPLMVSGSDHERSRSFFDRYILSEPLILRQAQDER